MQRTRGDATRAATATTWRASAVACTAFLTLLLILLALPAASPAALPSTPDPGTFITNGSVNAVAVAADGTTYLGGTFSSLARYTGGWAPLSAADGGVSATSPAVDGAVYACAADGSGGLYIGGTFTHVGATARAYLARILPNGGLDTSWDPGANAPVYALAVSGSTVYAGGVFTTIDGVARNHIAAIDASGNATAWDPNAVGVVNALAVSGTTVYAGGQFTTIGGASRSYIAALDATKDTGNATAWDPAADNTVDALAVSGTTVYAGGAFTQVNVSTTPVGRSHLAAFDAVTGSATAWDPDADNIVGALAVSGTTVYAGGAFSTIGGASRNFIAALDATKDTGNATTWNPVASHAVLALAVSGSTVYAGGWFTTIGGQSRNHIAAIDADEESPTFGNATTWDPSADDVVAALAVSADAGTVFAGGSFTTMGRQTRNNIAALDPQGRLTAWDPNASGTVHALAVSGTTVYAGGRFTTIGGQPRNYVAALDATKDTENATTWDPDANEYVYALAVSGSTVYAGGSFTSIGGASRNRIAALDATKATENATTWDPDANGSVLALAVSGTTVYAVGYFARIGGTSRGGIAALDATKDTGNATAWDPAADNTVFALAVSGSTVYAGGWFTTIGGASRNSLAALDATKDTGNATAWNPNANSGVRALAVSGTTVYAGGDFTSIGGVARNYVAALDADEESPTFGEVTAWNPDTNGTVLALAVSGGTVYAGGDFTTIGGRPYTYFAAFRTPSHTITASAGANGSISPSGEVSVAEGADQTFTITPDPGYQVDDVLVGGSSVGAVPEYEFTAVDADSTIAASFKTVALAVTGPTAAGVWQAGSTQSVAWSVDPALSGGQFKVWLLSASGTWYVGKTVPAVEAQSDYETNVNAAVPAAAGYRAAVYWRPTAGSGAWLLKAKSAAFSVAEVAVSAPTAADVWQAGSTQAVTWTVAPALSGGEFRLWLISSPGTWYLCRTVPGVAKQSDYETSVRVAVPAGTGYRVAVYWRPTAGSGSWELAAKSAAFEVSAATALTVTSPSASSSWKAGSTQTVTWTAIPALSGGQFKVWIISASGTWYVGKTVPGVDEQTDYETQVRVAVPAGSGYRVAVYWRPTAGSGDWELKAKSAAFEVTP